MDRSRLLLVLGTVLLALTTAPLAWGASGTGTLELDAGYAKSSQDETGNDESLGGGISFGGGFWYHASPQIAPGLEVSYDDLGNLEYDNGVTANNEASIHILRVTPELRVNFGQSTGPSFYVQAGAGLYNVTGKIDDSILGTLSNTDGNFGFNAGAGAGFPVSERARLNVTGLWHSVATEGDNSTYLQFRVGIGFHI